MSDPAEPVSRQWKRVLRRLDHLVTNGTLSVEEAAQLRATNDPDAFDQAMRAVRLRHARSSLDAAIDAGTLSRADADGLEERVRSGEHGAALRAQIRRLVPGSGRGRALPTNASRPGPAPEG